MRRSLLAVAVGLGFSIVASTASASHDWNNYHWARTTSSFNLATVDSVTATWQPMFNTSVSQWSSSAKLNLVASQGTETASARSACTPIAGKLRVCNYTYGQNGWSGLASINLDSRGHISQGTAKMNDSYSFTSNARYHVMCQEIGHVLGLDHTSTNGTSQNTCMDYSQSASSIAPNSHDYAELTSLYGHLDSYSSASSSMALSAQEIALTDGPMGRLEMAGGVPLGHLVKRERFAETYVAPDGKGGLWIHHITLAPGSENLDLSDE